MSDATHLVIPFAASGDAGCAEARRGLELPVLRKLLARLKPVAADAGDEHTLSLPHERVLARESGLPVQDGCTPWAAWHVLRSGRDPGRDAWAFVTPCHWQVGQRNIAMAPPQLLELTAADSQALSAAMRPYFEEDGIALDDDTPATWLARGEVFRGFESASLDRVIGDGVDAWLPRGERGKPVRRLQQEMQMLLYTHEVNDERARRGLAPVNSFWVSGTGALPQPAPAGPPPSLQVANGLREAALLQDWPAWAAGWRRIDQGGCTQLLARLDRGEQVALTLCGERNARTFAGTGGGFFGKLSAALKPPPVDGVLDSL